MAWQHPDADYGFASTLVERFKQKFSSDIRTAQRELKEVRRAIAALSPPPPEDGGST